LKKQESKQIFRVMLTGLEKYPKLDIDVFRDLMKDVQKETGIKGKDLWMPVRAAITGLTEGPELPAVLAVLGMQKVKSFLKQAVEL
jgi:glutamyl/glutaminyl-tRNA synthetase